MEKHRLSTYTSGHWVKASVADPMRNSLTDAIETEKKNDAVLKSDFEHCYCL